MFFPTLNYLLENNDFKTNVYRMHNEYLKWVGENYEYQKEKLTKWCNHNKFKFDNDVFGDTIVKVYDYIERNGLDDPSPSGFDNYLFKAFKNNIKREKEYSRVKNRVELPEINKNYEEYYNEHNDSATVKIMRDLKEDFNALYILRLVEDQFDAQHTYCFKLKFLYRLTYRQLQEKTKIKNSRQKVIDVLHWLREHVSKEDLENAFQEFKGEFL